MSSRPIFACAGQRYGGGAGQQWFGLVPVTAGALGVVGQLQGEFELRQAPRVDDYGCFDVSYRSACTVGLIHARYVFLFLSSDLQETLPMPLPRPLVRRGLTLAVAIVLTGCAAMSEEECRTAN